jgi:DNA-binding HxlR family transcriptional regulator
VLGKDYSSQVCSIAGALEVIGERWSLLIVRDVLLGLRRFDELQAELGIARNVLQARLSALTDEGVLERRRYQERPPRYEYRLTEKGRCCAGATATRHPPTVPRRGWSTRAAAGPSTSTSPASAAASG